MYIEPYRFRLLLFIVLTIILVTYYNVNIIGTNLKILHRYIKGNCPKLKVITVDQGGNTGNQIFEYLSVLSVSGLHPDKFIGYVPNAILLELNIYFENLILPSVSEVESCLDKPLIIKKNEPIDQLIEKSHNDNSSSSYILLDLYSARYEDIITYGLPKMRDELKFKSKYVTGVQEQLMSIKEELNETTKDPVFIGVHYRGTDYPTLLLDNYNLTMDNLPTHSFYVNAMKYFQNKYKNVVFILISVDYDWINTNQKEFDNFTVVFNPNENDTYAKIKDLVLLSCCNHTIINFGTYGIFPALYNGGETIVYNLNLSLDGRGPTIALGIAEMLDYWHALSN